MSSFRDAARRKSNVMKAVMLRDMRTRFFNHGLGFLLVIIWPIAHMFVLLAIYSVLGRRAPFGDSLFLFFATGLVPTLSFMYVSRQMAMSVIANKPMLSFPAVNITDIIFGRAILEVLGSFIMAAAVLLILTSIEGTAIPFDVPNAVAAIFATLLLAIGIGSIISLLAVAFPATATMYFLVVITVYLTSGTLFVPSYMPQGVVSVLYWNPVLHGVEWLRSAYFIGYPNQILDKSYMLIFGASSLFTGLCLERLLRPLFTSR